MSTAQLILWVIAIVVGLSSAWRNPTALALVLAFAVSEAGLPFIYYAWIDATVIAVIMMKLERSPADIFIMACYPLAWLSYVFDAPLSNAQWWHLFWIAVAQFFAVGAETTHAFFRARSARSEVYDTPDIFLFPAQPAFAAAPQPYFAAERASGGGGSG